MEVVLNDTKIKVVIERKNNKNIYFRVKEDLTLYITCSRFVSEKELLKLIFQNEKSIQRMYNSASKRLDKNSNHYYLGKKYRVVFDETLAKTAIDDEFIFTKDKKSLDKFYKNEAIRIFSERTRQISTLFDYLPRFELKIRSMKTRWGVCNKTKKTVTLNLELIKKDLTLLDYVIIHELCHFKYPHHQVAFWSEVAKYYPNYKKARKELKE